MCLAFGRCGLENLSSKCSIWNYEMGLNAYESACSGYFHSLVETVAFTRAIYIFADFYFLYSVCVLWLRSVGHYWETYWFFKARNISCFAENQVVLPTGQTLTESITSDLPSRAFWSNCDQNYGSRSWISCTNCIICNISSTNILLLPFLCISAMHHFLDYNLLCIRNAPF